MNQEKGTVEKLAPIQLSSRERSRHLELAKSEHYDLLIIGGGITGAGIALDAASRGLKTLLVEKEDFAFGTSSRSTKLIHGGLRYLKQLEFGLVREVGQERAIVYRNAPHVVIPELLMMPAIKGGTYGRLGMGIGLWLYDRLAGVDRNERRKMLTKNEALQREPLLRKDLLKAAAMYWEYRTDDARLTIEIMKTAAAHGALPLNYAALESFSYTPQRKIIGAKIRDCIKDEVFEVKADYYINAAGPWVDELRKIDGSVEGKRLHHTKGVHIVVPFKRLPLKQSVYFDVSDGRMVFAIPRHGTTYIGTTDTNYEEDLDTPDVTDKDVNYLLKAANYMFPSAGLEREDVISSWSGIRPLIHEEGKGNSELSRKDEIFLSESGLVSIAGGKLTGYRKMAERAVDVIMKRIKDDKGRPFVQCKTAVITIGGGGLNGRDGVTNFAASLKDQTKELGISPLKANNQVDKYGKDAGIVFELAKTILPEVNNGDEALLAAELRYCIEH